MKDQRFPRRAPGGPGIEPRWTHGAKVAVGTAYSTSSRVWYTLDAGCVTEVYYPTIDTPQIRDVQFLFTDGETFFHDERRNFTTEIDCISEAALGFVATNREKEGRYSIHKTILGDPHQNCLLVQTELQAPPELLPKLKMYVLCAPHLEIGGWHNNGEILQVGDYRFLIAYKGSTWLAIGATVPFTEASCGYVGVNDGWTDLADNYRLDWQYDEALDGNIALTGGLDLSHGAEFTVGVAFGTTQHDARSTLGQSLNIPFERTREAFIDQWEHTSKRFSLASTSNNAKLYERSVNLLLAHEDKTYSGAMIASLSIPWGDQKSDDELGGYHLVWTRDLVKSVTGLLAAGDTSTPLRSLIYLAVSQREDGGFYQNFWIDGRPYWNGAQLDEVAFPVLLTWRLWKNKALGNFLPFEMVRRACGFLIREGPITAQDRWEEASGYSPSTLAVHIAALICAAEFFDDRGEHATAEFVRDYADFLESHIEHWTVTTQGTLVPGIKSHYIRVNPASAPDCAHLRALESFSQGIGLIPEQIWDGPELRSQYLRFGGTTDAAMPLLWAHSEYVKLHRSAADRKVFDLVEPAYERDVTGTGKRKMIEVWKLNHQVQTVWAGALLRIQADSPFLLHWTSDDWQHSVDTRSQGSGIGIEFLDIPVSKQQKGSIRFTLLWLEENRWEGKDYTVNVRQQEGAAPGRMNPRRRKARSKEATTVG